MAVSLILTEQIIKLFIILLLGFLLVKFGLLKASDSKSVSVILVYLILPCMIINAFQIGIINLKCINDHTGKYQIDKNYRNTFTIRCLQ